MDLVERWYDLSFDSPRSLGEIRTALDATRAEMAGLERGTRRHSVLLERTKALRWATEPWWPELALTPWREGDQLNPMSSEEFEKLRPDTLVRSADDILEMGLTLFLHGSTTADIRRHGLPVFPGMGLGEKSGLMPRSREVRDFWQRMKTGGAANPEELLRMVWLSACADALFWAAGKLDALPEGDPPDASREALLAVIERGEVREWLHSGTRRSDAELQAEHSRQLDRVQNHPMGSEAHSFALQRVRALRWVLDYGFPDPTVTPWDGSDTVRPFTVAPVALSPDAQREGLEALGDLLGGEADAIPPRAGLGWAAWVGLFASLVTLGLLIAGFMAFS